MNSESSQLHRKTVRLIHHAANGGHHEPASSLAALEYCLATGASKIEIDVIPLADGSFALLHDPNLETATNGRGNVVQMGREAVENLFYLHNGNVTSEKVGFLDDAIDMLIDFTATHVLQLDFKPYTPVTPSVVKDLLHLVNPVINRVQVSSVADWAVRALKEAEPNLALGFDPLLYLDMVDEAPRPEAVPPFRVGAYGLLDDHPLSAFQWGGFGDYFAVRADALLSQVPAGCEWYIRADLIEMALDAGFDWFDFLHQKGATVAAWTIDIAKPDQVQSARHLCDFGVDELTTNSPSELAKLLDSDTIV
jgi:glycerophosphoryl diester phosphodiesterase